MIEEIADSMTWVNWVAAVIGLAIAAGIVFLRIRGHEPDPSAQAGPLPVPEADEEGSPDPPHPVSPPEPARAFKPFVPASAGTPVASRDGSGVNDPVGE